MIGESIKTLLAASSSVTALVGNNIFPYVADTDTQLPCLVYRINEVEPFYDKFGWCQDDITFSIYSFARGYSDLQSLVTAVRAAVEMKDGNGIITQSISKTRLLSVEEGYDLDGDVFYNNLTFKTILKSN